MSDIQEVKILSIAEIKERMADRKVKVVAKATDMHPATLRAIINGTNENPVYRVVYNLSKYFGESK